MAVKIRLSRIGTKHLPMFRIIAVDSREKRDGKYLDYLGTYDALHSKVVKFNASRIDEWVAKGAILSDTVKKLYRVFKRASKASNA